MREAIDRILTQVCKPARYSGGEWNSITKDWQRAAVRLALAFPDVYEVGMSNLGLAILYDRVNRRPDALGERVFAPWPDMSAALRAHHLPLFSLESRRPLADFDIVGFSLGYEQTYTNVLEMLDLAGLPVLAAERSDAHPIVIAGGSCALNAEPMADFVDLFVLGEGEEVLDELLDLYLGTRNKEQGTRGETQENHALVPCSMFPVPGDTRHRDSFLLAAARIPGIYVPSLYRVEYQADGTIAAVTPREAGVPRRVRRRLTAQLPPPLTRPIVPFVEAVHDRAAVEVMRGCTRGCRFCQASTIYRPRRQRPPAAVVAAIGELLACTGYDEVSLLSLSSSDYDGIAEVVRAVRADQGENVAISLPSLRVDNMSVALTEAIEGRRKAGFTFAVEAGSQRLRDVINKGVDEEDVLRTAETVFSRGWQAVKFYFMLGLPSETLADVEGIVELVRKVQRLGRQHAGHRLQIRVSASTFVPKPHTPFQWVAQDSPAVLARKHDVLRQGLRGGSIKLSWHDPDDSLLEAALARGDRRLGRAIYHAWRSGCVFDAWSEHFHFERWQAAFQAAGLDPSFYAHRARALDEVLPWSHLEAGVTPAYLRREFRRALAGELTPDCHYAVCSACGLHRLAAECAARIGESKCSDSA